MIPSNNSSKFIQFLNISSALIVATCLLMPTGAFAQTFKTQVTFEGTNGDSPGYFPLVQAEDGNLYGTTALGGYEDFCFGGCGTIFKLTPAGNMTTQYNFCPGYPKCSDGMLPQSLVLASFGGLVGTSWGGGGNYSTIFEIAPDGEFWKIFPYCLYRWPCDTNGFNITSAFIEGWNGNFYGTSWGAGIYDKGSVYGSHLGKSTGTLHSFCSQPNCADGEQPFGALVQATDGNFYGVTESGGAHSLGTIFKITKTGKLTTLYSFGIQADDGGHPWGGLVQATDGNFYGTTSSTVFKITSSGALTTLHTFNGSEGGLPQGSLVQGGDGNFYGTTSAGGDSDCGTIFQVTPGGALTTLHSFTGAADGCAPLAGLVENTNGTFYGTTSTGGDPACDSPSGCGTVFSLYNGLHPFVSLLPAWGTATSTIGILGQGFTTASNVSFGSAPTSFSIVSDTYLTAVVPAEGITGQFVNVTTSAGTLTSNTTFKLWPVITGFSPTSGPVGTQVTITGGGFNGATKVTIGGGKVPFVLNSGSQITATVSSKAQTGVISVTTASGVVKTPRWVKFTVTN